LRSLNDGIIHRGFEWREGSWSFSLSHLGLLLLFTFGKWRRERIAERVFSILHRLIRLLVFSINTKPDDFLRTKVRLLSERRMHSCWWSQWLACSSFLLNP
jgi:hypothetical protein